MATKKREAVPQSRCIGQGTYCGRCNGVMRSPRYRVEVPENERSLRPGDANDDRAEWSEAEHFDADECIAPLLDRIKRLENTVKEHSEAFTDLGARLRELESWKDRGPDGSGLTSFNTNDD